jgi:hypothetical protein
MAKANSWAARVLFLFFALVARGQETQIAPSFVGQLSINSHSGQTNAYVFPSSTPRTSVYYYYHSSRALAQWDLPPSATNFEGVIRFNAQSILRSRNDVFVFGGALPTGTNLVRIPLEFLATLATNSATTNFEVDVSPWLRQFAGGKLGLEIVPIPDSEETDDFFGTAFGGFSLSLLPPASYDAPPHIRWKIEPARKSATQVISFSAEVVDLDTPIERLQVLAEDQVVAEKANIGNVVGTNVVVVEAQSFPLGEHTIKLRVFSGGKSADSQERKIFVYNPATTPKHYYVDLQESARSFYVVDALGQAFAWGSNEWGQLGLGDPNQVGLQVRYPASLVAPDGLSFRQISAGSDFAVGLMNDGSLYVWGNVTNHFAWGSGAARGEGFTKVPFPEETVFFTRVVANDLGFYALDQRGMAWRGYFGGLLETARAGDDLAMGHTSAWIVNAPFDDLIYGSPLYNPPGPAKYPAGVSKWISAATSNTPGTNRFHNLAIGDDLQLYAWGTNTLGELPITNLATTNPTRVNVPGVSAWTKVATSERYSLALAVDGRIFGWGPGFLSDQPNPSQPKLITFPKPITNWLEIAVTDTFALAVDGDGELFAWGRGPRGMWHDPNAEVALLPEKVQGLPNLLNQAASTAAQFNLTTFFNQQLTIWGLAPSGTEVPIQISSDLKTWTDFRTVLSVNGVFAFLPPTDGTAKFYRIRP